MRSRNDTFGGVEINPVEDDDVSAVTEAVKTTAVPREYIGFSPYDQDVEQPTHRGATGRTTTSNILDEPTVDGYDEFFDKVFNTPASIADTKDYEGTNNADGRRGWVLTASGAFFIVLAVLAVLFGTGVIEVSDRSSTKNTGNGPSSSLPGAIYTAAPAMTSGDDLLPESGAPTTTPTSLNPTSVAPSTSSPTVIPTTQMPTLPDATPFPTQAPSIAPTTFPTQAPSIAPTLFPTKIPTSFPTQIPTTVPTRAPTAVPTRVPTSEPSGRPELVIFPTQTPILDTEGPTLGQTPLTTENSSTLPP